MSGPVTGPLLELRRLAVSFATDDGTVHAVDGIDLSLASAVKRHVRFVYEQASRNQRRAAKLLDISRATLARHLRKVAQK